MNDFKEKEIKRIKYSRDGLIRFRKMYAWIIYLQFNEIARCRLNFMHEKLQISTEMLITQLDYIAAI